MADLCVNELWIRGPQTRIEDLITACQNVPQYYKDLKFKTGPVQFSFSGIDPLSEEAIQAWENETDTEKVLWEGFYRWGVATDPIGPFTINTSVPDELYVKFQTERMEPEWWIQKASRLYPDLTFELKYYQEVANFTGEIYAADGSVQTHRHWDMSNQERIDRGLDPL